MVRGWTTYSGKTGDAPLGAVQDMENCAITSSYAVPTPVMRSSSIAFRAHVLDAKLISTSVIQTSYIEDDLVDKSEAKKSESQSRIATEM